MTKEEAIKLLHRDTTRGAVAKLEYYAGFNGEKVIEQIQEAMDMGAEALKKQIPKKPKEIATDDNEYICSLCPICNSDLHEEKYCAKCGQAIDWSEEE